MDLNVLLLSFQLMYWGVSECTEPVGSPSELESKEQDDGSCSRCWGVLNNGVHCKVSSNHEFGMKESSGESFLHLSKLPVLNCPVSAQKATPNSLESPEAGMFQMYTMLLLWEVELFLPYHTFLLDFVKYFGRKKENISPNFSRAAIVQKWAASSTESPNAEMWVYGQKATTFTEFDVESTTPWMKYTCHFKESSFSFFFLFTNPFSANSEWVWLLFASRSHSRKCLLTIAISNLKQYIYL